MNYQSDNGFVAEYVSCGVDGESCRSVAKKRKTECLESSRKKVSKHDDKLASSQREDGLNWQVSQLVSMGFEEEYRGLASRLAVLIFSAQFLLSCAKRMLQIAQWLKRGTGEEKNKISGRCIKLTVS